MIEDRGLAEKTVVAHSAMSGPSCRSCGSAQMVSFIDLGMSPLCESFVPAGRLNAMEPFYPLHAYTCSDCLLVQLDQYVTAAEFSANMPTSPPIRTAGSNMLDAMSSR